MKHYLKLFLLLFFFLPSLACGVVTPNTVQGSGKIIKQDVDVSGFDRVTLAASGDVYIEQGSTESLTIEADDNILPKLDTRVTAGELVLSTKPNLSINPSRPIIYRLTVKDLEGVSLQGSGNFHVDTIDSKSMKISILGSGDVSFKGLDADSLAINLSGSGNCTVDDLSVKTIDTTVNGSGDINLNGKAATQTITFRGSGNYVAGDLQTESADIQIPGSGDITVWVTDQLQVDVDGSGDIKYYGNPTIDQSGNGSGHLKSLGKK